jgi:hypothetical protein
MYGKCRQTDAYFPSQPGRQPGPRQHTLKGMGCTEKADRQKPTSPASRLVVPRTKRPRNRRPHCLAVPPFAVGAAASHLHDRVHVVVVLHVVEAHEARHVLVAVEVAGPGPLALQARHLLRLELRVSHVSDVVQRPVHHLVAVREAVHLAEPRGVDDSEPRQLIEADQLLGQLYEGFESTSISRVWQPFGRVAAPRGALLRGCRGGLGRAQGRAGWG